MMNEINPRRDLFAATALNALIRRGGNTTVDEIVKNAAWFGNALDAEMTALDAATPTPATATRSELSCAEGYRRRAVELGYRTADDKEPKPIAEGATINEVEAKTKRWIDFIRREEQRIKPVQRWSIPPNERPAKCKTCGARIFWVKTDAGKPMPVDPDGSSHFTTCPNADAHRKRDAATSAVAASSASAEPETLDLWDGDNDSPGRALAAKKARNVDAEPYGQTRPVNPTSARLARMWAVAGRAGLSSSTDARAARIDATNVLLLDHGREPIESWKDASDADVDLIVVGMEGGVCAW